MESENISSLQSDRKNDTFEDIHNNTNQNAYQGQLLLDAITAQGLTVTLYAVIFTLSVSGNSLVLVTLIREKRLRTITNLFLLNLALSDMLLSVLCMPFTLVATVVLRDFIFGEAMCILIRYFQAVSVGVSCYTLVAISLERYYAICQPLKSRRWQTLAHARRMIVGTWASVLLLMSPIAAFQRLVPIRKGGHACRELWPAMFLDLSLDKSYSILLAAVLLLVPLVLMSAFYGLMARRLWTISRKNTFTGVPHSPSYLHKDSVIRSSSADRGSIYESLPLSSIRSSEHIYDIMPISSIRSSEHIYDIMPISSIRSSDLRARDTCIAKRKRVIRMLLVIVLQYFICWSPIYILNTWQSIDFLSVFRHVSPTAKSFILLLAYTSSLMHPLTYCFMNQNFRSGLYSTLRCASSSRHRTSVSMMS